MLTIGCCGRARHGKGTLAKAMERWFQSRNQPVQVISLADPLKDFLALMIGRKEPFYGNNDERNAPLSPSELRWEDLSKSIRRAAKSVWGELPQCPTGRQMMQLFGTEVARKGFCADVWVRIAAGRAKAFDGVTIVDDVRFPNEAILRSSLEWVEGFGGLFDYIFKVVRPGIPLLDHSSERCVDEVNANVFEAVLINDGSEQQLADTIGAWLTWKSATDKRFQVRA